jgi:tetratricopeptide (TPR) repeat protein
MSPWGFQFSMDKEDVENRLDRILAKYPHDAELLFLIAMLRRHEGRTDDALALLDNSIDAGNHTSEALLERATLRLQTGNSPGAKADISETLCFTDLSDAEAERAVRALGSIDEGSLESVPDTAAVRALKPRGALRIAVTLTKSRAGLQTAVRILTALVDDVRTTSGERRDARQELSAALIGLGRFIEAKQMLRVTRPAAAELLLIQDAFNYAMAEWGETNQPPQDLFRRVIELHGENGSRAGSANYSQCLAVGFWAVGDREEALRALAEAEARIQRHQQPDFSCWRYLITPPSDFLADCAEIRRLIEGEAIAPRFTRQPAAGATKEETPPRRGRVASRTQTSS